MPQTTDNHAFYQSQIHQLKQLQNIDDKIFELRSDLEKAPRELKSLQDRFAKADTHRARILDQIAHLREQEQRLVREMDDERDRLRKSKDKLMATGNEREYTAVTREIDTIEKMSQPREDDRIRLLDELKTQNGLLATADEEYRTLKAQLDARQSSIDKEMQANKAKLDDLLRQREECSRDIPRPIFHRYEFIRERLEHPVIVALKDVICPSCHIAVPPQTFNDLLRGGHILSCPNCQRLIVSEDDYFADDPEAQARKAAERALEPAQQSHRRASPGRSAALDKDFREEKDEVDFGQVSDDQDEAVNMETFDTDINNMSRTADVSDLADMSEMPGLGEIVDDGDDAERDKH